MTFYVSLVLVIVAAVTLVIGLLQSGLWLVIVSIGASFLAGVFLILTVMRERPRVEPAAAPAPAVPAAAPPAPAGAPDTGVVEFPIAEYDDLKVSEIVPLLPELDDDELEMVFEHEEATKARTTVLNRIDELFAEGEQPEAGAADEWAGEEGAPEAYAEDELPIADYDDLRVGEIVPLLPELDDDELEMVREHEEATKGRATVLDRIDEIFGEEPAPAVTTAPTKRATAKKPASKKAASKKAASKKSTAKKAASKKSSAKKSSAKKSSAKKSATAFPIANYDALTVADVAKRLTKLDESDLKTVRTYEKRNKSRKGVLDKIDDELARR